MKFHPAAWLLIAAVPGVFGQDLTPASVAADRALWPKTVRVSVPITAPVIIAGKESGTMQLPAGREYPVKAIGANGVTLDVGGSLREVPAVETDLLDRSAAIQQAREARQSLAATAATPAASASPTPRATPAPKFQNAIGAQLSNLVALNGKSLTPFDAAPLATKKYIAAYYSASWCGPCRAFTPDLVKWYKRNRSKAELFEIVFVSADRSAQQMEEYMAEDKMPWPALEFGSRGGKNPFSGKGGPGIPSLVVFDAAGSPVAESYVKGEYVGPRKVLEDFEKLLRKTE